MAVSVDFVLTASFHTDVLLCVNADERYFLEHLQDVVGLRLLVGLHVVANAVDFCLDELALRLHGHSLQHLLPSKGVGFGGSGVGVGCVVLCVAEGGCKQADDGGNQFLVHFFRHSYGWSDNGIV